LLEDASSHNTFGCIEPEQASRDFTNRMERFDDRAIQPEMVRPWVLPRIEQRNQIAGR
jgi:hypothetical protein